MKMDFHEIASIFPLMGENELSTLADDVKAHGLLQPIVLHEGKILDGRNRYLACQKIGIEPRLENFDGGDPLRFVISANLHRRHLSESQRAVIAKRLAKMPLGGAMYRSANLRTDGISQPEAAKMLNVSERSIQTVAAVERAAPDLIPHIERGGLSAHAAKRIVDTPEVFEPLKNGTVTVTEAKEAISRPHVAHNSGNSEWYTPKEYIARAVSVMGAIDLDPASTEIANTVVGAACFYTPEEDGLTKPWQGRVFMNPPYASELIGKFVDKLLASPLVTEAIVLVNNATETRWFQALAQAASAVCFPSGRVKFWNPDKESAPLQGQAVLYIGESNDKFIHYFSDLGCVWRK